MKRIIILVLTLAILFISVFDKYSLPVNASDGTTTEEETVSEDAYCATANALMWEMLQTYLYGIAGQQAYDTYANDPQAQANLYADFCDWVDAQKWLTQVEFTAVLYGGSVAVRNGRDVINYYKTAGSSALADVQEEAYKGWTVIKGGLNENNEEPQISPTSIPTTDSKGNRIARIAGMGTLIGCIGGYIKDLVNGERGEISDTFNGVAGIPDIYFDGNYNVVDKKLYGSYQGNYYMHNNAYNVHDITDGLFTFYFEQNIYNADQQRPAIFLNPTYADGIPWNIRCTTYTNNVTYYCPRFYYIQNNGDAIMSNTRLNVWAGDYYVDLAILPENIALFSGIPVFNNYSNLLNYLNNGDLSGAVNYFDGEVVKPSSWLDYQMANIAQQLQQILQAFTNLPTITTDDLAGFATSISQGLAANTANIQAMTQEQLQQFMANLNMDSAKNVTMGELTEYSPYTGAGDGETVVTPKPTLEPCKEYQRDNARMMVDLSQFFPFCIPYDLVHLIKVLNAEPVAPKFETTIKYAKLGINEKITLDLSSFNDVAKIFRTCEILLFILGLILLTRNIIRG